MGGDPDPAGGLSAGLEVRPRSFATNLWLIQSQQGVGLVNHLILARASRAGALPVPSFDARFCASQGVEWLRESTAEEPRQGEHP